VNIYIVFGDFGKAGFPEVFMFLPSIKSILKAGIKLLSKLRKRLPPNLVAQEFYQIHLGRL
jgi:hypothetical protein